MRVFNALFFCVARSETTLSLTRDTILFYLFHLFFLFFKAGAVDSAAVSVDENVIKEAVHVLRQRLGLALFGFDGVLWIGANE